MMKVPTHSLQQRVIHRRWSPQAKSAQLEPRIHSDCDASSRRRISGMDNERPGDDEQKHQGQFGDETLGHAL